MAKTKGDTVDDVIAAIGRTKELKDKICCAVYWLDINDS